MAFEILFLLEHLYLGTFAAMLIETIFPPIPSEIVLPTAGYLASIAGLDLIGLVGLFLVATLGSTVGALIIYYLSRFLGRHLIIKYGKYVMVDRAKIKTAERWFEEYGVKAVFFGRMAPGIRELVSIPAGFTKMDVKKFLVYTFAGSFIWTSLLGSIGYFLGRSWQDVPLQQISNLILIVIILSIASYIIFKLLTKRRR